MVCTFMAIPSRREKEKEVMKIPKEIRFKLESGNTITIKLENQKFDGRVWEATIKMSKEFVNSKLKDDCIEIIKEGK